MRYFLGIFLAFLTLSAICQVSEANISIQDSKLLIGEQTTIHFVVSSRENKKAQGVDFDKEIPISNLDPDAKDSVFLEIIEKTRDTFFRDNDVFKTYVAYKVTAWDVGKFMIPPRMFLVKDEEIFSPPVEFQIETVKVDTTQDIRPIKSILLVDQEEKKAEEESSTKTHPWIWISIGIALLLIMAFLIWYIFRKPKNAEKKEVIQLKPHEEALLQLQAIHTKLMAGSENKEFYSEMTDTLRIYIEKRFEIPALEKTSTEILTLLRYRNLTPRVYEDLKDLLELADLVKFAKSNPEQNQNELDYLKAVGFVNSTKPFEILDEN